MRTAVTATGAMAIVIAIKTDKPVFNTPASREAGVFYCAFTVFLPAPRDRALFRLFAQMPVQNLICVGILPKPGWLRAASRAALRAVAGGCVMFGTTALKLAASIILVAASASGPAGFRVATSYSPTPREIPVALDDTSLLVATLATGELQTQWMPRDACERVASAVVAGDGVAGIRSDGVKVYITRANCSTRRIEVNSGPAAIRVSQQQD
jgi:hypothetical protein